MKKQLLILITLFISVIGYSQTFTDSNFITYNIISSSPNPNTVEVIGYSTANGGGIDVDIPNTVDYNSASYTVTSIGNFAFVNKLLTSVIIPNSVITIGEAAFAQNNLSSLVIGTNVTSIGYNAFFNNQLTSITIPSNVTSIGEKVFQFNPLLTEVISESTTPPIITTGGSNDTFGVAQRGNINLTIPNGTENDYIAAQWINFAAVTLNFSDFELDNHIKVITTADAIRVISADGVRLENYTIYSISGAQVSTGIENDISTASFAKGIYILKLDFDLGIITKKIVIQ